MTDTENKPFSQHFYFSLFSIMRNFIRLPLKFYVKNVALIMFFLVLSNKCCLHLPHAQTGTFLWMKLIVLTPQWGYQCPPPLCVNFNCIALCTPVHTHRVHLCQLCTCTVHRKCVRTCVPTRHLGIALTLPPPPSPPAEMLCSQYFTQWAIYFINLEVTVK